ncbi:mucin-2-like isoform X2 [Neocloeon triangulifer]|uniref:mucin-2-like isoform X2 n=1 Tax=Neocloeon triangulifer TaxID=2078957 RepID=UPI00286F77F7|nr:mucin-2-like isoform X2 [Neocloeon triangulifer]
MSSSIAWLVLTAVLAFSGTASSAWVPKHNVHRRQIELPALDTSSSVSEIDGVTTLLTSSGGSETVTATEVVLTPVEPQTVDNSPNVETSVLIQTKSSQILIPVERNPSLSTLREERVFLVFPEAPTSSTQAEPSFTTVAPQTENGEQNDEEQEEVVTETLGNGLLALRHGEVHNDTLNIEKQSEAKIIFPEDNSLAEISSTSTSTTTTEEPSTTTASTTVTTETTTVTTKTTEESTLAPSTTTVAPSTTRRGYRGTPRATKKTTIVSTTSTTEIPTTSSTTEETTNNLTKSTTKENDSSESQESDENDEQETESTTHKVPHFEVAKKETVLRPAPRPSARLVEFLKNRPGGAPKRFNLHTETTSEPTSSPSASTTTTTTTKTPETTTKPRRNNLLFGARNKPKMLDRSASELEEVTIAPPETALEMRKARFYSSASSLLSGFVPSIPLPRVSTAQMSERNSRKACANPAGCVSPQDAEALMASIQDMIKNSTVSTLTQTQTAVSDTTNTIRNKIRSRRPNLTNRQTSAAPSTTTESAMRSIAQRLAHRRRTTTTSTTTSSTTTSTTTTPVPKIISMKQIQDLVVSPAPIMVTGVQNVDPRVVVSETTTVKPIFQRYRGFEKRPTLFVPHSAMNHNVHNTHPHRHHVVSGAPAVI